MNLLKQLLNFSHDEIITEASKAQKLQLKKAQADEKRREQLAAKKAEEERLAAILAKKQQKKMTAASQKIADVRPPEKKETGGWLDHSELSKYVIDPNIDTDFKGGYYLRFHTDLDGTVAYWSKGDLTFDQAASFKQMLNMGKRFNANAFQQLVDNLVDASAKGGQPGYVHIEIDKKFINNPFFIALYSYLLREYPTDDPTVSGTVNWELV